MASSTGHLLPEVRAVVASARAYAAKGGIFQLAQYTIPEDLCISTRGAGFVTAVGVKQAEEYQLVGRASDGMTDV